MFDAEAKYAALERRIEALEKEVKELKKKDKTPGPVAYLLLVAACFTILERASCKTDFHGGTV